MKKAIFATTIFLSIFCLVKNSEAATYYVAPKSTPTENMTDQGINIWQQNCTNPSTPCSAETAMKQAQEGDTVYFKEGLYSLGECPDVFEHAKLEPSHSGSEQNPITFIASSNESPIIDCTHSTVTENDAARTRAIGTNSQDYIIWDGFTVQANGGSGRGGIVVWGVPGNPSIGCQVRNCIVTGGEMITFNSNVEGIRIQETENALIKNCKIYSFNETTNAGNLGAVKMYSNVNATVENCEIYDCTEGIFDKGDSVGSTFRYNYIHDIGKYAIYVSDYGDPATTFSSNHRNMKIYHNVVAYVGQRMIENVSQENSDSDNMEVYNNTFYSGNAISASVSLGAGDKRFYNNIIQGLSINSDVRLLRFNMAGTIPVDLMESDYNNFGSMGSFSVKFIEPDPNNTANKLYNSYTSLSSWQNSGELADGNNPDQHSFASDPQFANVSGRMNALSDFEIGASCIGTGKNNGNIGADISLVGFDPENLPAEDITLPNVPAGLSVS